MRRGVYVYLAGPYRGGARNNNTPINVAEAIRAWNDLTDLGFIVFCPHLNMFLDMFVERDPEWWLEWDKHWLLKCDAVFRMSGESAGSDDECSLANDHGIPVFTSFSQIKFAFPEKNGVIKQ